MYNLCQYRVLSLCNITEMYLLWYRACKSRDCFARRYEIHVIIASLGTVRA